MFNLLKIPCSVLVSVVILCVCVCVFLAIVSFGFFFIVSISLFVMTMCLIKSLSTFIIAVLKSLFANYNISVISGHFSIDRLFLELCWCFPACLLISGWMPGIVIVLLMSMSFIVFPQLFETFTLCKIRF